MWGFKLSSSFWEMPNSSRVSIKLFLTEYFSGCTIGLTIFDPRSVDDASLCIFFILTLLLFKLYICVLSNLISPEVKSMSGVFEWLHFYPLCSLIRLLILKNEFAVVDIDWTPGVWLFSHLYCNYSASLLFISPNFSFNLFCKRPIFSFLSTSTLCYIFISSKVYIIMFSHYLITLWFTPINSLSGDLIDVFFASVVAYLLKSFSRSFSSSFLIYLDYVTVYLLV